MDVVFLDFAKALDKKVPNHRLLEKLSIHGVRGENLCFD